MWRVWSAQWTLLERGECSVGGAALGDDRDADLGSAFQAPADERIAGRVDVDALIDIAAPEVHADEGAESVTVGRAVGVGVKHSLGGPEGRWDEDQLRNHRAVAIGGTFENDTDNGA